MTVLRPVAEHLSECLAVCGPLTPLSLPLSQLRDTVLAEAMVSTIALPGFDNSAMDGYAVHADDVASASEDQPVRLPVVDDLPAGRFRAEPVPAGTAVRIMTGAPVPPSGRSSLGIVPVEDTDAAVTEVTVFAPTSAGRHVRRAGEDVAEGQVLLPAGSVLTPTRLALAAAVGAARLTVYPRPRVLVLATGSELVEPGQPLAPGQLYESNGHLLAALVEEAGAVAVRPAIVPDEPTHLRATLAEHLPDVDLVLTSGGVSAGAYDTVKEVLLETGTVHFRKVAMQPGMPQGCGVLHSPDGRTVPILTLPGNPVSTFVSFEVFARPALAVLTGATPEAAAQRPTLQARAAAGWRAPAGKVQFARVHLTWTPGSAGASEPEVVPVGGQRSHLIADLSASNALARVPEEVTAVEAGDLVTVWPL